MAATSPARKAPSHATVVGALLLTACIWGGSFPAIKVILAAPLPVGVLLALRFTVGAAALAALLAFNRTPVRKRDLLDGLWLGLVVTAVFWLQTDGLRFTTPSKSGFITGLYVIFTPLVALLVGDRLKPSHGLGAAVAVAGLFLLVHEPGAAMGGWNRGDSETLACAALCGVHMVMMAHFSRRSSGMVLALVQLTTVAAVSWVIVGALGLHHGVLPALAKPAAWGSLLFLGLLASAGAFYVQSTMQAYVGATEAALIFSMEPVFSMLLSVSGWIPGVHDRLSATQFSGAGLILAAMLVAELGPRLLGRRDAEPDAIG